MSAAYVVVGWVTGLLAAALVIDRLLVGRRPLAVAALWNATLVATLALVPAVWLVPRWELALLPAEEARALPAATAATFAVEPEPRSLAGTSPGVTKLPADAKPLPVAPPTTATPQPVRWLHARHIVIAAYLLGAAVGLSRLMLNVSAVLALRRRAPTLDSPQWKSRLEKWRPAIAPSRDVALLVSSDIAVPIALGWRRPAIVIPLPLMKETSTATIDAVLVHELAHVERADCAWQIVERIVQAVYWIHPLVWLVGRRIAEVRERACDDFAVHQLGSQQRYAEVLIEIAAGAHSQRPLGLAMAVVRASRLEQRLAAIERSDGRTVCRLSRRTTSLVIGSLVLAASGGACVSLVRAQNPDAQNATETPASEVPRKGDPLAGLPKMGTRGSELRDAIRAWRKQLQAQKFKEFAGSFAPSLAELLPPESFEKLIAELTAKYGKLQRVEDRWEHRRYGLEDFNVLKLTWERAEVELRFVVDRHDATIKSLCLAPLEGASPPEGFDADQYRFGESAQQAADATLSISMKVVDPDGQPMRASVWFYRALAPTDPLEDGDWHDPVTGKTWRRIDAENGECAHLPVGIYRAAAAERHPSGHSLYVPFGLSEPFVLDGSTPQTAATVQLKRGSSLIVHTVEAATGQALSDVHLVLKCADQTLPPMWEVQPIADKDQPGVATFDRLPPAKYELHASKRAHSPSDVERAAVDSPVLIDIQPDVNRELTIKLRTSRLDEAEIAKRWPWVAVGHVTDPQGRPMAGATVRMATGWGTLLGGGSTTTDAEGRYRLHFGEGILTADPVSLQSAVMFASKPGFYETNLNRQGGLAMARRQPEERDLKNWGARKIVFLPGEPREVSFELASAATLDLTLLDAEGQKLRDVEVVLDGNVLPPASSVLESGRTDHGGGYTFENAPLGFEWWIAATAGNLAGRSQPFAFTRSGTYRMTLRLRRDAASGSDLLEVQSIKNSDGEEIKPAALRDDPLARPPVTEAQQTEAREILKKLIAANDPWWFARPPAEVQNIRYDFCFTGGERQSYAFDQREEKYDHWTAHGLSYSSATALLCGYRKSVTFRMVEVTPERIRLGYTTKGDMGYSVGNGVRGTWHGFASGRVREGILTIDPRRWVPLEHTYDENREVFSDFVKLKSGQWAPRHIVIEEERRPRFDWKFDVYEPGLWLFSSSGNTQDPGAAPIATLENVVINGQPGKRIE